MNTFEGQKSHKSTRECLEFNKNEGQNLPGWTEGQQQE
jgi:hypothetical protein